MRGVPALLEQGMTKAEIAAMYGVTLGTLVVCCSRELSPNFGDGRAGQAAAVAG